MSILPNSVSNSVQMTTLDNGLRVVTDRVQSVQSVALGIWSGVGARHEEARVNGAAHMVEHMLFKGTHARSAQQIVDEIENVGGHMNAYTSRDLTSYHCHLLKDDASLALDVLSDMYQRSTLLEEELTKERHVILQEIGMCQDTPDDLIFDTFFETAYADQATGRPILGPASIVQEMARDDLQAHIDRFYTPSRSVICAAGNIDHDRFVEDVAQRFDSMRPDQDHTLEPACYTGGDHRLDKTELEQTHVILGFEGVSRAHKDFYAMRALANILGGGMSSRLFQEVREKRGLVYSVFAFAQSLSDTGQFGIYAGTGPKDVAELMPVLCDEILKIQSDLREEELTRVKAQMKASLMMRQESMMSRADTVAKTLLHKDKLYSDEDLLEQIDALSLGAIQRTAQRIFATKPTLSAIGPVANMPYLDELEKCLVI